MQIATNAFNLHGYSENKHLIKAKKVTMYIASDAFFLHTHFEINLSRRGGGGYNHLLPEYTLWIKIQYQSIHNAFKKPLHSQAE